MKIYKVVPYKFLKTAHSAIFECHFCVCRDNCGTACVHFQKKFKCGPIELFFLQNEDI